MYALIDCNNFFVSCERVFRPDLWQKPVLVMSGNDGCVIARSNEVKALGIPMGAPIYQIRSLIEQHHICCFSSNFALYGDLSARVMSILRRHTARLEQYSIDEAFISLSHLTPDQYKPYCERLVRTIHQGTGIPVSIGIAPTKTLAKVASKYAKKYPGYHGACLIDTDNKRIVALRGFDIRDVWGIGRKAQARLAQADIKTALDFAERSATFARNLLHKPGLLTWRELNGEDCIDITTLPEKQSITTSRTFATALTSCTQIEQQLADFCDRCARQLRMQRSVCRQILVYAHTSRYRTDIEQHVISECITLPVATADTRELLSYALPAFRKQFRPGIQYKKAGITLLSIQSDASVQQNLFDERDREKDARLQKAIDRISHLHGKRAVLLGSQIDVASATSTPAYHQEHRSPLYTTDIHQILTIKI